MKCMHVCPAQTTYLFFTKLLIEPDFPCLTDEIAEPHPDMNIKNTAITESIKFYYSSIGLDSSKPDLNLLHANNKGIDQPAQSDQCICYSFFEKQNDSTCQRQNSIIQASPCS